MDVGVLRESRPRGQRCGGRGADHGERRESKPESHGNGSFLIWWENQRPVQTAVPVISCRILHQAILLKRPGEALHLIRRPSDEGENKVVGPAARERVAHPAARAPAAPTTVRPAGQAGSVRVTKIPPAQAAPANSVDLANAKRPRLCKAGAFACVNVREARPAALQRGRAQLTSTT